MVETVELRSDSLPHLSHRGSVNDHHKQDSWRRSSDGPCSGSRLDGNWGKSKLSLNFRIFSNVWKSTNATFQGLLFEGHIFTQFCSSKLSGQSLCPLQNLLGEMQRCSEEWGQSTEGLLQAGRVGAGALAAESTSFDGSIFGFTGVVVGSVAS